MPEQVESLPSRRDGVHGGGAGRAGEPNPTLVPGSCARRDVAVREGAFTGGKVVIPGHHIGAVGLGGHRGSIGEDIAVYPLLGAEGHQLGREGAVARRAEPRRGEEQEERETSLIHKIMIPHLFANRRTKMELWSRS